MRKPLSLAFAIFALVASGAASASSVAATKADTTKDIVDTAIAAGSFGTLAKALQAADLVGALKGAGPFTVFAPTDEAFAKLPAGTLESLLLPENKEQLRSILLYHVVSGKVTSGEVVKLKDAKTLQGGSVAIKAYGGAVKIDGATVVKADVMTSNGVIHVIDTVILPTGT